MDSIGDVDAAWLAGHKAEEAAPDGNHEVPGSYTPEERTAFQEGVWIAQNDRRWLAEEAAENQKNGGL